MKNFRLLTLDGGGIRGIFTAMVLAEIERRSAKPVSQLFDVLAGTSTGGILALGLTLKNAAGQPRYSAAELVELYENDGPRIFSKSKFWTAVDWVAEHIPGLER